MTQQERAQRSEPTSNRASTPEAAPLEGGNSDQLKKDLDNLLDEIDEVLEENAEEFVKGYVQKGGQ